MRVIELGIENFRKFRQPIRLTGFDGGLNLVCEPNETGKSTVLEALRAVLFERHGSKSDRIHSFRPQGDDVAPTVDLVFEIGAETWRVRKRFLQKPEVTLEGPNTRATGDEAEEKLQSLLGFTRAGNRGADADTRGALGLLWVEQGQSFVLGTPGQAARRTLEDVLAGEVGAVTGGRRTPAVIQSVEKSLAELLTGGGKPTRRLLEAQQAAEAAGAEANEARQELEHFDAVLDRLETKRNEHRRLMRDLSDPEQEAQLADLLGDIERAKAAGQTLRTSELVLREAVGERERLEARTVARSDLRDAFETAEAGLESSRMATADHREALTLARDAERSAAAHLTSARSELREAGEARKLAQVALKAAERRKIVAMAFARLDAAETISKAYEKQRAELSASTMTEDAADTLQDLEQAAVEARSAATAGAAVLQVCLGASAPVVQLNGAAVDGQARVAVTERQVLEFADVGTVTVEPPLGGEAAQAALRAAEQDLSGFLAGVGFSTAAEARAAARARANAETAAAGLFAQLSAACPADPALGVAVGLEALRGALAGEERSPTSEPPAAGDEAADDPEARWDSAQTAERDAEGRRQAAVETLRLAELEEVRLAGHLERAATDRQRFADDLAAELNGLRDDDLGTSLDAAKTTEARALVARGEARRAAEGLDEAALNRRRESVLQKRDRMREDRLGLVQEIATLEERAKTLGGAGPASRAAAAAETAEAARGAHERLKEEAEVLSLLDRVIREAQLEASRRFLAPITQRIAPFVARLLPNATLALGDDYSPRHLVRGGREEAAESLSKGTQEQLAVLTRIAFADLLIEKGKPASLVLDDALVFADDDRFETMMEILAEAAKRMQVIILSCRTSAYRTVDAKRIVID